MNWTLIFTAIGIVATAISMTITVRAENESKRTLERIEEEHSRNIENKGNIRVSNSGNSSGTLVESNSGDTHERQEMTVKQTIAEAIKD